MNTKQKKLLQSRFFVWYSLNLFDRNTTSDNPDKNRLMSS